MSGCGAPSAIGRSIYGTERATVYIPRRGRTARRVRVLRAAHAAPALRRDRRLLQRAAGGDRDRGRAARRARRRPPPGPRAPRLGGLAARGARGPVRGLAVSRGEPRPLAARPRFGA